MDDETRRSVGRRIAEVRRNSGLTQRELADLLGVTQRSVQNYEAGTVVPYKHLRRIERLGHKPLGWILDGESDMPDILTNLAQLQRTMERHQALMVAHLEALRSQTDRMRVQRQAREERRRASAPD